MRQLTAWLEMMPPVSVADPACCPTCLSWPPQTSVCSAWVQGAGARVGQSPARCRGLALRCPRPMQAGLGARRGVWRTRWPFLACLWQAVHPALAPSCREPCTYLVQRGAYELSGHEVSICPTLDAMRTVPVPVGLGDHHGGPGQGAALGPWPRWAPQVGLAGEELTVRPGSEGCDYLQSHHRAQHQLRARC